MDSREYGFFLMKSNHSGSRSELLHSLEKFFNLELMEKNSSCAGQFLIKSSQATPGKFRKTLILTAESMNKFETLDDTSSCFNEALTKLWNFICTDARLAAEIISEICLRTGNGVVTADKLMDSSDGSTSLRLHSYDADPEGYDKSSDAIMEHVDSASFSMIYPEDNDSSLEVYSNAYGWVKVCPEKGTVLIMPGLAGQILSNNQLRASQHRIKCSPSRRLSAAVFVLPNLIELRDCALKLGCLKASEADSRLSHSCSEICSYYKRHLCEQNKMPILDIPLFVSDVKSHWALLHSVVVGDGKSLPSHKRKPYWRQQIVRYWRYMCLKSQALNGGNELRVPDPPREIYYVWLVHMLQPAAYVSDCMENFGALIPHHNHTPDYQMNELDALWRREYARTLFEEQMPDFTDEFIKRLFGKVDWWLGMSGVKKMHKNVLKRLPKISQGNDPFIQKIISNYHSFLQIALKSDDPVAPGLCIDFAWHTHQCCPQDYMAVMLKAPKYVDHLPAGDFIPADTKWRETLVNNWRDLLNSDPDPELFPQNAGKWTGWEGCCAGCRSYTAEEIEEMAQLEQERKQKELLERERLERLERERLERLERLEQERVDRLARANLVKTVKDQTVRDKRELVILESLAKNTTEKTEEVHHLCTYGISSKRSEWPVQYGISSTRSEWPLLRRSEHWC